MYGLGLFLLFFCCLQTIKMLLHDLPISEQSFISVSYLVFEIRLLKLNDNNNNEEEIWKLTHLE